MLWDTDADHNYAPNWITIQAFKNMTADLRVGGTCQTGDIGSCAVNISHFGDTPIYWRYNGTNQVAQEEIDLYEVHLVFNDTNWTGTINTTVTTALLRTKQAMAINCTSNFTPDYWAVKIENLNDSVTHQINNTFSYTINESELFDAMRVNCYACTGRFCYYGAPDNILDGEIDASFTFRPVDPEGTLLSSTDIFFLEQNQTLSAVPTLTLLASSFLNNTMKNDSINITASDNNGIFSNTSVILNLNENQTEYNISMNPYDLTLTFFIDNTSTTTTGHIFDSESKVRNFSNATFIVHNSQVEAGQVKIRFNNESNDRTQFFEYIADANTVINEEIEIINTSTMRLCAYVITSSGRPIDDARVQIWYGHTLLMRTYSGVAVPTGWTPFKLMGQRLSREYDGYVDFNVPNDEEGQMKLVAINEGYVNEYRIFNRYDLEAEKMNITEGNCIVLRMEIDDSTATNGRAWLWVQSPIFTKTADLLGNVVIEQRTTTDTIEITTDYRISQGLSRMKLNEDILGRYPFTLDAGTDFTSATNDNISIMLYVNNALELNYTIVYDNSTRTDLFSEVLTSGSQRFLNPIIMIVVILASMTTRAIFSSDNIGMHTFGIGMIVAGIISSSFLWATASLTIYYLGRLLHKIISE